MCTRFDSELNSHTSTRKLVTTLIINHSSILYSCVCYLWGEKRTKLVKISAYMPKMRAIGPLANDVTDMHLSNHE